MREAQNSHSVNFFNNLDFEFPILGSDPDFRDGLSLGGDSVRGAARLPGKFFFYFLFI